MEMFLAYFARFLTTIVFLINGLINLIDILIRRIRTRKAKVTMGKS